jgi:hypothetical protein
VALGQTIYVADVSSLVNGGGSPYTAQLTAVPTAPALGDGAAPNLLAYAGTCTQGTSTAAGNDVTITGSTDNCVGLVPAGSSFDVAFPLLVEADDSTTGTPLGYAYSNTNGLTTDGGTSGVALAGPWQTNMPTQTLSTTSTADSGVPSTTNVYSEQSDGVLTPLTARTQVFDDGGFGAQYYTTHPGFAQTVQAEAQLSTAFNSASVLAQSSLPPASNGGVTLDVTPLAIAPVFSGFTPNWTLAQPTFSWTMSSGSVASATGIVVVAGWGTTLDGGAFQSGTWTIVSPGTATNTLTAPLLPASFAALAPSANVFQSGDTLAAVSGGTGITTYASFLQITSLFQGQAQLCQVPRPAMPPIPGLGSVVLSFFLDGSSC